MGHLQLEARPGVTDLSRSAQERQIYCFFPPSIASLGFLLATVLLFVSNDFDEREKLESRDIFSASTELTWLGLMEADVSAKRVVLCFDLAACLFF